jgi:hypothetical protein
MASLDKYKLTSVTWDSDKSPTKFCDFMFEMSAMVRAIDHGNILEDFLDAKLGRAVHQHVTTPTFLSNDPEFVKPSADPDADELAGSEDESVNVG